MTQLIGGEAMITIHIVLWYHSLNGPCRVEVFVLLKQLLLVEIPEEDFAIV